jgi:hypothetical protein
MQGRKATKKTWSKFLDCLSTHPNVVWACKVARISRTLAYGRRGVDKEFAKAWDEALNLGIEALQDEAVKRAFKGSDKLMMFLLNGLKPDTFKYRVSNEHTGPNGGPIEVSDARDRIARRLAGLAAGSGTPEGTGGSN